MFLTMTTASSWERMLTHKARVQFSLQGGHCYCFTFLVTEIATVLEGSDHAVAVIDLGLALVENEPDHDLASGTGQRLSNIFHY